MKMSLVAKFDDLCRSAAVLTEGDEEVFLSFITNQESCHKKWLESYLESQNLHARVKKLQDDNNTLCMQLKQCRNVLSHELAKRKQVEEERDSLMRQISLIKELVLDSGTFNDETREKLAFLNTSRNPGVRDSPNKRLNTIDESSGSILSPSDFDITEDDLDQYITRKTPRRSKRLQNRGSETKKRPSAPPLSDMTPPKKCKSNELIGEAGANESLIATTTVTVTNEGPIRAISKIETRPDVKSNRSFSEPIPSTEEYPRVLRLPLRSEGDESEGSVWTDNSTPVRNIIPPTPFLRSNVNNRRLSIGKIGGREHSFCTKTIIKPEKCISCDKRIKFGKLALKCRDCRTTCHTECKDGAPTPCTPVFNTPRALAGCVIGDFAPKLPPFIPVLVLYCVMEVEKRGLEEVGVYRVPGSERDVKDLKEKFLRGKGVPNLSKIDIHVICGCLKDFLRSLREPLITFALWNDFVNAAENPNEQQSINSLMGIFNKLPEANKDTLAYLMLHLQMVSETPACKMPTMNLAKVLAPTIVGYSSADPEGILMLNETQKQTIVLHRLLMVSKEFWSAVVNTSDNENHYPETFTPVQSAQTDYGSDKLLSSASKSSLRQKKSTLGHTPLGTRDGTLRSRTLNRPQHFFASPMLQ